MKNLTWQNPEQLFVAQVLINKVKSKCCGIKVNYSYQSRYLFTATFRADGSSKFAPNNHWGYFPAAAAAWRISDEPWMKGTQDWLSNLKLRLSFGTSGNDNIDASLWKATWISETTEVDGQLVNTFRPGTMMANPDLKWETTISPTSVSTLVSGTVVCAVH